MPLRSESITLQLTSFGYNVLTGLKMYKHGKPIEKFASQPIVIIVLVIFLLLGAGYIIFIRPNKNTISNNNTPLVSTVSAANQNTLINEADFTATLPGNWTLAQKDWDARYNAWQWQSQVKNAAGRWFRVYQDTIPTDYSFNYLMPVTASGESLIVGTLSTNCADFTTTAQTKNANGTIAALAKWQQTSFYCDYGNQTFQVVGTSSPEGINTVTLAGPKGKHKYFFLYQDSNFNPDYGIMSNILSTFKEK
jgi:hypothetical protein